MFAFVIIIIIIYLSQATRLFAIRWKKERYNNGNICENGRRTEYGDKGYLFIIIFLTPALSI